MPSHAVRTFHHDDFPVSRLTDAKGSQTVSVCFPARDEEATIGAVVTCVRQLADTTGLVDEIVVVDDGSTDATAACAAGAGARVVATGDLLPEYGAGRGKGEAMWKSLYASDGDLVVWCDADVRNFGPSFITGLLGPLLTSPDVVFVKGFYRRPLHGADGEGGRVTELVARPLMSLLFPQLVSIAQPLAGEYAGRREVLERVPFVEGWGVDLGLLVDIARGWGVEALAQVDLGVRVHRNRSLEELGPQAMAVLLTALRRAGVPWSPEWSTVLARPGLDPVDVEPAERPALLKVPAYRRRSA